MLNIPVVDGKRKRPSPAAETFLTEMTFSPAAILTNGFVRLTAAQAGLLIKHCRYEHQKRDQTAGGKEHITVLADLMKRRQWRDKDKLDFALKDGKFIILNGHHRLTAQALAGVEVEWTIVIHLCATDEDLAALYYTFDTNLRIRSSANIIAAADLAALIGIKATAADALWRAVPLVVSNFDFAKTARDPLLSRVIDRRLEFAKALQREIIAWEDAISSAPSSIKRRLASQGPCAVALMTFRHTPKVADEFWRGVAENDGLRKGDPRHTYLRALTAEIGSRSDPSSPAWNAAICWNAFYERRSLTLIKIAAQPTFRIAGTPIGKR